MTPDVALRDRLAPYFTAEVYLTRLLADPSVTVTATPPCPTCEGTDDPGEVIWPSTGCLTTCPTCHGTGYLPPEWATVDQCLDWLDEHCPTAWQADARWRCVGWGDFKHDGGWEHQYIRPHNFHAACIAACVAVAERGQG